MAFLRSATALPFLIEDQFRRSPFGIVCADYDKIHTCQNSETSVSTEFAFKLISQIGCLVVQELYSFAIWQWIFEVYILSDKRI